MSFAVVFPQSTLVVFFLFVLLPPHIFFYDFFVYSNRTYTISSRPDMHAPILLRKFRKFSRQILRTLPFQYLHHMRRRMLWGYGQIHMDMVVLDRSFQNRYFLPFAKFPQYLLQPFFYLSHQYPKSVFRYPHKMVFAPIDYMRGLQKFAHGLYYIIGPLLTNIVGSLMVWCLRPHAPPLTLSVV